jgi:hypothetical protein
LALGVVLGVVGTTPSSPATRAACRVDWLATSHSPNHKVQKTHLVVFLSFMCIHPIPHSSLDHLLKLRKAMKIFQVRVLARPIFGGTIQ